MTDAGKGGIEKKAAAMAGSTPAVTADCRPRIAPARSWISRNYARFWMRVPFMTDAVPGCGVCAMNAALISAGPAFRRTPRTA